MCIEKLEKGEGSGALWPVEVGTGDLTLLSTNNFEPHGWLCIKIIKFKIFCDGFQGEAGSREKRVKRKTELSSALWP